MAWTLQKCSVNTSGPCHESVKVPFSVPDYSVQSFPDTLLGRLLPTVRGMSAGTYVYVGTCMYKPT